MAAPADNAFSGADDQSIRCGTETCQAALCGYECAAGALCESACFDTDGRPDTYVKFNISGAVATTLDSRNTPYVPAAYPLSNSLWYGADLWKFQEPARDGLDIVYKEIIEGAVLANDPSTIGPSISMWINNIKGAGVYSATADYSSAQTRARNANLVYVDRFFAKDTCQVELVQSNRPAGGFEGTVTCNNVPGENGRSIQVTGEFYLAANALQVPLMVELAK